MKIHLKKEKGSIQVTCLIVCAILGIGLASYLKLVRVQNISVARSQLWNMAIPICEAGVEEALAQINSVIGTNYVINGWTLNGVYFEHEGTIGPHRYFVQISTNTFPQINATAYISGYLPNGALLGAINAPDAAVQLKRKVLVTTTRWSTGMKGIIAKQNVEMIGISEVDSFDSEDER